MSDEARARVVHCKREPYDIYIGRPGKWGNPFRISGDSEKARETAVRLYKNWLDADPSGQRVAAAARRELRGKVLGCWCAPKACHGDVLAEIANERER